MTKLQALQPVSVVSRNDSLLIALFIAVVIHAIVLLGITFKMPEAPQINKSLEITLVTDPVKKNPPKAHALAMHNQAGGGQKRSKPETPKKILATEGRSQKKIDVKPLEPLIKPQAAQKVITQKKAAPTQAIKVEKIEKTVVKATPTQLLSPEDLELQIAQLGAEIAKKQQPSEDDTRIKFVNSVSAHQYLASQYISDWEEKVERTGNLNYPEIARKKGFSGRLTLDVGINADGSIYSMRISKSSGHQELDDAAKEIVKMSAPFPHLPKALLAELDVLVIKRVWSFSDESGMTAH